MRLYVNIDHVATVRQARKTDEPDPVRAAVLAELGGADGITVHLREDRRHIQDRDVRLLMETVRTAVNLELAVDNDVMALALEWRPMQVTLVPERREEVTTEGGLNLAGSDRMQRAGKAVERLREAGIRVSLFVDPDPDMVRASRELAVEAVEFHTGEYALARGDAAKARELARLREACEQARELELAVHAGHGLTYENVVPVAAIPEIEEVNIGHSIVSRAVFVGMERAVAEMRERIAEAPSIVLEPGVWLPPLGY
jgi:pyridoxine 5-phosphate synthase